MTIYCKISLYVLKLIKEVRSDFMEKYVPDVYQESIFKVNYELLKSKLDLLLRNKKNVVIISGFAIGADKLGERYAKERNLELIRMPAKWNKFDKMAGYIRNVEMAKVANACVVFWDGSSKGSKHMIDTAERYNLELRVIKY